MPYTAQHKADTRKRIVRSARRLFNRNGFAEVSIDDIMEDAGLTRGGFYKHFSAKEDLYREAVLEFICGDPPEAWQARYIDPAAHGPALARMIAESYLSDEHFADRDASCPMIGLPSDTARGNPAVKAAFSEVLEMMARAFIGNLPPDGRTQREQALATVATMVGGMVLARAVNDAALADEVRDAARRQVFDAAGWSDASGQAAGVALGSQTMGVPGQ
jgi:AcrR family transcriptional regulator